jgi:hypothetical protein
LNSIYHHLIIGQTDQLVFDLIDSLL